MEVRIEFELEKNLRRVEVDEIFGRKFYVEVLSEEIFKFLLRESGLKGLEEIFFHEYHLEGDSSKKLDCEQKKIVRAGYLEVKNTDSTLV